MLKQAAILLATLAISACVEDTAVSSTTETEKKKAAALKEATKAAIVIQTYEIEENKVIPAHKSEGAGGAER